MTVATTTSKSGPYAGAGTTGPFTVEFRFLENSHLAVTKTRTDGVDVVLVLGTDYTVSGAGASTGSVLLSAALASGERLTISRNVPATQEADYVQNDAFPAESHERALDKLTMLAQQNNEALGRTLKLPVSVFGVSATLPPPLPSNIIGWNQAGNALENLTPSTIATVVAFGTANADIFTGDGTQTAYTLTASPGAQANLDVSVGGVTQLPSIDYVWAGGVVVTFTSAPPMGAKILLRYFQALPQGVTDSAASTFIQSGAGAKPRNVQIKARERVSIADFINVGVPSPAEVTAAFQAAVNSGAKRVFVTEAYTINATINLAANQVIDFDGGSLTMASGSSVANGLLYGLSKANIRIIDPVIDGSATSGECAINLKDCPGGRINDGTLTKANLALQATSNATRMGYKVRGMVIDMGGWLSVGCYISAANGVTLSGMEIFGGKEGVGVYNDARDVKHAQIDSYGHTQDGFVIIAGQRIDYTGCMAYNNGQSGFTTQRQSGAENTRRITFSGCHAYDNVYDGFDLRGANAAAFAVDMLMTLTSCIASGNTGCGFYVVYAEGTALNGCVAFQNAAQNFRIDTSLRTQLSGCRSVSGARGIGAGTAKAGIEIYNSNNVSVNGSISSNESGATQDYGISFTGTSVGGQITGGYYENNTTAPYYLGSGGNNRMTGAQADTLSGSGVFTHEISFLGLFEEEGFGAPVHTRPKGSIFMRTDGGGGEWYVSNGAGSWTAH